MPRLQPLPNTTNAGYSSDSLQYHFGFQLAIAGDLGVGKSELIVGMAGGGESRIFRHGYRGIGTIESDVIYVAGNAFEIDCDSPADIETADAAACCLVYCDEDSLQYALKIGKLISTSVEKYLVFNLNEERTPGRVSLLRVNGKAAAEAASYHFFEINLFQMTGLSTLQRAILDNVWSGVPNPPEASLVNDNITLGTLYTKSPAWAAHLRKNILDVGFENGFRS